VIGGLFDARRQRRRLARFLLHIAALALRQVITQRADLLDLERRPRFRWRGPRLLDAKDEDGDRKCRGDCREPEHGANVVVEEIHQADRQDGAERGADRVERLAQAEGGASHRGRRQVGDKSIARRAADSLADAVEEPGREHEPDGVREREERLGRRREAATQHGESFAPPERI
jgi:hypothetical protein